MSAAMQCVPDRESVPGRPATVAPASIAVAPYYPIACCYRRISGAIFGSQTGAILSYYSERSILRKMVEITMALYRVILER